MPNTRQKDPERVADELRMELRAWALEQRDELVNAAIVLERLAQQCQSGPRQHAA